MATTFTDATAGRVTAWPLQGRTDSAGVEVVGEHFDGKDAGILLRAFTAGILGAAHYQVVEDSPTGMTVVVGSGSVGDVAVLSGTEPLQPTYAVAWPDATTDVTVPAADLSNPRIDEIYLVVEHDQFDVSGRALPRLALRDGTPASSPVAPGPDASWTAFTLLASLTVSAGATEIVNADITDERVIAQLNSGMRAEGTFTYEAGFSAGTDPLRVLRSPDGFVHLQGQVDKDVNNSDGVFGTLPLGFRPGVSSALHYICNSNIITGENLVIVRIAESGTVQVLSPDVAGTTHFGGVTFLAEN